MTIIKELALLHVSNYIYKDSGTNENNTIVCFVSPLSTFNVMSFLGPRHLYSGHVCRSYMEEHTA